MPSDRTQPLCQTSTFDFAATKARRIRANARRGWRSAAGGVQLLLRGGRSPRGGPEELLVQVILVLSLVRRLILPEEYLPPAPWVTPAAFRAPLGAAVGHPLTPVEAV